MIIFLEVLLRCALGFGVLLLVTRMIGNKQLGQMNIFTYISGIAIGAMAGGMIIYHDIEILESFLGMFMWGFFTIMLEYITMKSRVVRRTLSGQPVIVIAKGKILYRELQKERLSLDDLTMLLRSNHIYRISDVEYAILEINGELSIMKKSAQETVTKNDLNIPTKDSGHMPIQVIAEGTILKQNLAISGHTEEWIIDQIEDRFNRSVHHILYAEIDEKDNLYIQ